MFIKDTQPTIIERVNPLYTDNSALWQDYINSYKGGEAYRNSTYLIKHDRERTEDFNNRLARSCFVNICETIINTLVKFIFTKEEEFKIIYGDKSKIPENLQVYVDKFDRDGNSIVQFYKIYSAFLLAMGHGYIIFDALNDGSDNRIFPAFINPLNLINWKGDRNGYKWLVIKEVFNEADSPYVDYKTQYRLRVYCEDGVVIYDTDRQTFNAIDNIQYKKIAEFPYPYPFGFIPIETVILKDSDFDNIGESFIQDVVYTQKTLYNLMSLFDENFYWIIPQLIVPRECVNTDGIITISAHHPLVFGDDGLKPEYISAAFENVEYMLAYFDKLIQEAFRAVGLGKANTPGDNFLRQSGVAIEREFVSTNETLSLIASNIAKSMERSLRIIATSLDGVQPELIEVMYPKRFDTVSPQDEINDMKNLLAMNLSGTMNKKTKEHIVDRCEFLSIEDKNTIKNELTDLQGQPENNFAGNQF